MDPDILGPSRWALVKTRQMALSIKNGMGPNPNGPRLVSCDRATRYSGFFGVRSVGPVGDFLRLYKWVTEVISFYLSLFGSRDMS